MRTLILSIFFVLSPLNVFAYSCASLDQAAKYLNPNAWMSESRVYQLAKKGDPIVELASKEAATKYVYRFPALEKFGFGSVNELGWKRVVGRMENSALKGQNIGWERKLEDGSWARIRLDYSPTEGAHYNIEVRVPGTGNKFETHNLAVKFGCGGRTCTQDEVLKMVQKLN